MTVYRLIHQGDLEAFQNRPVFPCPAQAVTNYLTGSAYSSTETD
jgi:hypothetical protein